MVDSVVTQGHKIAITGGDPDAVVTQSHKVILVTLGSTDSIVSGAHKIMLVENPSSITDPDPTPTEPNGSPVIISGTINITGSIRIS